LEEIPFINPYTLLINIIVKNFSKIIYKK